MGFQDQLRIRFDRKIFLEVSSYSAQCVLLALHQSAVRVSGRRLRGCEVDAAERKARRRFRWLDHRLRLHRKRCGRTAGQPVIVSNVAGHCAATGLDVGGVNCDIGALSAGAAIGGDCHGYWTALRAAGIGMDGNRATLHYAVGIRVAGDGWRQALLRGKACLAACHGLLVVRVGHVSADVVALTFRHARGVDGYAFSRTFYFAAVGGPIVGQSVLGIEIVGCCCGLYRLACPHF